MKFLYMLTQRNYFSSGPRGRVTHACGIVEGLTENNHIVTLITDPNSSEYMPKQDNLISFKRSLWLVQIFIVLLRNIQNYDVCIIRWRPVIPLFTLLLARKTKENKIIYELNDFSGLHSKSLFVRVVFYISLYLAVRWSRIYVVSEAAKNALRLRFPSANVCVVENGISENFISKNNDLSFNYETGCAFSLIYFGGYRNYYDWEMINYLDEYSEFRFDYSVHLYGFNDELPDSRLRGSGCYNNARLMEDIFTKHKNPILILPGSKNLKATMGFPTKLYEYLYVGCPVLCSNIYQDRVSKSIDNWYFYNADEQSSIIRNLTKLISEYGVKEHSKINNRFLAQQNTWKFKVRAIL